MSTRAIKGAGGGGEKERIVEEEEAGRPEGRVDGGREAVIEAAPSLTRREDLGPEGWPGNVNSIDSVVHAEPGMTAVGVEDEGDGDGDDGWSSETR